VRPFPEACLWRVSVAYTFSLSFLWRFSAFEWQTLVPSVSSNFEVEFEEESITRVIKDEEK
jgi:hypothetical protein